MKKRTVKKKKKTQTTESITKNTYVFIYEKGNCQS